MTYYADTSWWLNFLVGDGAHHTAATGLFAHDHVAVALTLRAPVSLSFDADQNALAQAAGLDAAQA